MTLSWKRTPEGTYTTEANGASFEIKGSPYGKTGKSWQGYRDGRGMALAFGSRLMDVKAVIEKHVTEGTDGDERFLQAPADLMEPLKASITEANERRAELARIPGVPLTAEAREDNYRRQNGSPRLTARQARRLGKKGNRALARGAR